jgi:integrase
MASHRYRRPPTHQPVDEPAWAVQLEDLKLGTDRADSTKDIYERELRGLVLLTFEHFTVREVIVSRIERFLKQQRAKSYTRAKHSRTILSMVLGFAVRREIIARNPVQDTSRRKKPPHTPKARTLEQISGIRGAARDRRMAEGTPGPRPDGQVRDLIEVMLGTATRIGEALALRKCDVDMASDPPRVNVSGTVIVRTGVGVYRQEQPKTHESNRVVAIPAFAAEVIRNRLALITGGGATTSSVLLPERYAPEAAQCQTDVSLNSQARGPRGDEDQPTRVSPNRCDPARQRAGHSDSG